MKVILVKHKITDTKAYLFTVPEDVDISPMADLLVETRRGKIEPAISLTPSFEVDDDMFRAYCGLNHTTPERMHPVVGMRFEVAIHFDDEDACMFWSAVCNEWEKFLEDDDDDEDCDGDCGNCSAYDPKDE